MNNKTESARSRNKKLKESDLNLLPRKKSELNKRNRKELGLSKNKKD